MVKFFGRTYYCEPGDAKFRKPDQDASARRELGLPAMKILAFKPRTAIDYQARINRVLAHMAQHLDADLGTEELAREASLSAFHFHRIFRAITGETIGGLVRRLRLERAGQALRRGAPLIEVALDAGYGSPEAFGRAFREAFGVTPDGLSQGAAAAGTAAAALARAAARPEQSPALARTRRREAPPWMCASRPIRTRLAVCARHVGPYNEVGPTFRRMFEWASGAGVLGPDTMVMGLSYDNPETQAAEELRYDVCFSVRGAGRRSARRAAARDLRRRALRRAHAARAL